MQPIRIPDALGSPGRRREATGSIALDQVFDDGPRFRERQVAIGDHGGLAQWMNRAKRRRREHRLRVTLVAFHFVLEAELFEQPEDTLRARVIEVMDDDHLRAGRLAEIHPVRRSR